MDKKRLASGLMTVGGCIEILMGLIHFLMPIQLVNASEIAALANNYKNIILLETFAIGLCLFVFGILTIYFSRRLVCGEKSAWIFGISQGVLWMGRTILELLFPVTIPLFFLSSPTALVLPVVFLLGLLFLVPLWMYKDEFVTQ